MSEVLEKPQLVAVAVQPAAAIAMAVPVETVLVLQPVPCYSKKPVITYNVDRTYAPAIAMAVLVLQPRHCYS